MSIKILLFGKAGSGKSTFINTSFGELVSKSSGSLKSVTSKCTEYLLPYRINSENEDKEFKGRIMLIDTPGFENEKSVKTVKNEIEKYTKNAKDTKDMVHCALFFLGFIHLVNGNSRACQVPRWRCRSWASRR